MCLSVRVALTPPYVQVMQRKTSLSQEQGLAGSNPAESRPAYHIHK